MSLPRPAAGGESCKQDSFLCIRVREFEEFLWYCPAHGFNYALILNYIVGISKIVIYSK